MNGAFIIVFPDGWSIHRSRVIVIMDGGRLGLPSYISKLYKYGVDLTQPATDLLEVVALVVRGVADNRDLSLTAVAALGTLERRGGQRITSLAATEGVSQPSMTQLVQRLEQRGLVARSSDPSDGRVALVALTDEGRAALKARRTRNAHRIAELLADLPNDDVQALADALHAVLPAIRRRVSEDARMAGTAAR